MDYIQFRSEILCHIAFILKKEIMNKIKKLLYYNAITKEMCGHSKLLDIFLSRLFLKVPYNLYVDFCFYDVPWSERSKYILDHAVYALRYNPGVTRTNHDDKRDLMKKILPYLKRRIVLDTSAMSYSDFTAFCDGLESFFYKPEDGDSGVGIKKVYLKDHTQKELFETIKAMKTGVLEETIQQHPKMKELNPDAVSTIRFMVFKHNSGARILFSTLRTSITQGSVVDNAGAGGCFASVDIDKGEICNNAYSESVALKSFTKESKPLIGKNGIEKHPLSGTKFIGFKIPFYENAKELVLGMANNINFYNRRLLGFDIAITENGPLVVEVNANRPCICGLYQTARKSTPLKEEFERMMKE